MNGLNSLNELQVYMSSLVNGFFVASIISCGKREAQGMASDRSHLFLSSALLKLRNLNYPVTTSLIKRDIEYLLKLLDDLCNQDITICIQISKHKFIRIINV